ncbi:MAG: transglutaminase family protein [Hyphomonas sp.]|nr:transglutaminase family protein [Hyphomonas sp.]
MRLRIDHTTTYEFEKPAAYALQQVRKRPHDTNAQTVMAWDLVLDGAKDETRYFDQHGNHVDLISIEPGATRVSVTCRGEVETRDTAGVVLQPRPVPPLWLYRRFTPLTEAGKGVKGLVGELGKAPAMDLDTLHALMNLIADMIKYDTEPTGPDTSAEEAVALGHGVCQDHAHVFLSAARLIGFPARYASGYMMMLDRVDQEAGHAWAEAWVDGLGWVGFDAANRVCPDERYIQVATGLDYREAGPLTGVTYGGGSDSMSVTVQVQQQ